MLVGADGPEPPFVLWGWAAPPARLAGAALRVITVGASTS